MEGSTCCVKMLFKSQIISPCLYARHSKLWTENTDVEKKKIKKETVHMSTEEKWQKYVLVILIKLHDSSARYQYFGEKGSEQVYSVS